MNFPPKHLISSLLFFVSLTTYAGFSQDTLVHTPHGLKPIDTILLYETVISWNVQESRLEEKRVVGIIAYEVNRVIEVDIASERIIGDETQSFSTSDANSWIYPHLLDSDNELIDRNRFVVGIKEVNNLVTHQIMYDLLVEDNHNFCVGARGIIAHNFVITVPFLVFGLGEVSFATGALGVLAASGASSLFYKFIKRITKAKEEYEGYNPYPIDYNGNTEFINDKIQPISTVHFKDVKIPDPNGAQAPGKPTEADGFRAPKNCDGSKKPHPKNGKYGWLDDKGRIWVPTGPKGHRGPHWDRQYPDGSYDNVLPGGRVVGGNRGKRG